MKDVISKLKLRHEKALAYVIDTYMPYVKAIAKQILEQPCGNWAVDECETTSIFFCFRYMSIALYFAIVPIHFFNSSSLPLNLSLFCETAKKTSFI
ncbi:hypothetical protein [Ureibacillus thermosphaericus]|uniref:hypothetical protein n=1 Tax=Ureibacillus thermosphaericus TaxID=51173 RepID=UPI002F956C68